MEIIGSFVVYYILIGFIVNTLTTIGVYWFAYRNNLNVQIDWLKWLVLGLTWPLTVTSYVRRLFGR